MADTNENQIKDDGGEIPPSSAKTEKTQKSEPPRKPVSSPIQVPPVTPGRAQVGNIPSSFSLHHVLYFHLQY